MANETQITLIGNLTADPELLFTQSGAAVTNFTVASTPRTFDRQTQEWFLNCHVWRQAAENVAESLTKGMRVIVQGRLRARSYTDRDGNQRTVHEVQVDEIGPSLQWATAQVTRTSQGSGNHPQQAQARPRQQRPQQRPPAAAAGPQIDPWGADEEPPF